MRCKHSVSRSSIGDKQIIATIFMVVLMLLSVPLQWLVASLLAALIHELGHYIAVYILDGTVYSVSISPTGAIMKVSELTQRQELISLFAGPAAGLLTLLLINIYPPIAFCGFVQSMYNLLPVYPLDGGRILCIIVQKIGGSNKQIQFIEHSVIVLLLLLCILIRVYYGISLFLFVVVLLFRKTPCKHDQNWI